MNIPTKREREMSRYVVEMGGKIAQAGRVFGVSASTIRRAMDKVTNFSCSKFSMELGGDDWQEIIGWLENGNFTSNELAGKIVRTIEGRA